MATEFNQCLPKKIGVISLGCSKNRINSEQMMFLLSEAGYFVTSETDGVDFVLLNTCGFIESAKAEAIDTILELAAAKDEGRIGKLIVAGCLPQRYKNEILSELPEINAVVGTGSFDDIKSVVEALETQEDDFPVYKAKKQERNVPLCFFGDIDAPVSETDRIISTSPVWAYLKISEGCDNKCAYCCIPEIRGRFRSRPLEKIIKEAKKLVEAGVRELIIVAQDVTRYGLDLYGEKRLKALLDALNQIKELKWIRLHYMYPDEFDDEIIEIISKSGKILKYLDIPIQHINDGILKKMNRRGTGKDIRALFKRLRESIPDVVIRTSIITGLPGEGEKEFKELCDFLSEFKIERVGVFAYSPEEGTAAAIMDRPGREVAEERAEKLLEIQSLIMHEWNKSRIGSVVTVLLEDLESEEQTELFKARSYAESPEIDGYINVKKAQNILEPSPCDKKAEEPSPCFIDVRITGIENGELAGEPR